MISKTKGTRRSRFSIGATPVVAFTMSLACATGEELTGGGDASAFSVTGTDGTGGIGTGGTGTGTGGSTGGTSMASGGTGTGTNAGDSGTGGSSCGSGQKLCGTTCVSPSPTNGCGDAQCAACPVPAHSQAACSAGTCDFTCDSGYSKSSGACVADPTCTDGTKNGTETDVDCGGAKCPKCAPGKVCSGNADCAKGPCESGICGCTPATCASASTCAASFDDGCGKTLDCSQSCTTPAVCYQDKCCTPLAACPATSCDAAQTDGCGSTLDCSANCPSTDVCFNKQCCTPMACGTQCGHPTDGCGTTLDCGLCADGKSCKSSADCASGACENGTCVSCTDGKKNNGETDVDCGGANCAKCANGSQCNADSDCSSNRCCTLLDFGSCFLKTGTCQ